jgi:uncharacterized protein
MNTTVAKWIPDINILLSGATNPYGIPRKIFDAACEFRIIFVLADEHYIEMQRILSYEKVLRLGRDSFTPASAFGLAATLYRIAEHHSRLERFEWTSCSDPKDWYLLDLLLTSNATGIITKDKHLLELKSKLGLPVFRPEEIQL